MTIIREMALEEETPVLQFETPTTIMVCGPTNSGKTTFVKRLLEHASVMFKEGSVKWMGQTHHPAGFLLCTHCLQNMCGM